MIKLTPKQSEVYTLIHNNPDITQREMMVYFGTTKSTIKDHIYVLEYHNLLKTKLLNSKGLKSYRVNKRLKVYV